MNIRNHLIELQCNQRDVTEVSQALIHSLIFFRTHGKFNYKHEENYSIGTLGYERAICDRLDFSYIRCSSSTLSSRINNKIQEFYDKLNEKTHSGSLTLEFYTKRPNRWPFNDSKIVWELWNIKLVMLNSEQQYQHRLEDALSQKLLDIIRIVNNDKCSLPQMPTRPNLDTVFDTSFYDLQPYLYNLTYKISENVPGVHSPSVVTDSSTQSTLKKFLLGTLEL